jgi:ketosteroid isomerase-like protein
MWIPDRLSKACVVTRIAAIAVTIAVLTRTADAQTCGTPGELEPAAARSSLGAAEQDAAAAMSGMGFGEVLPGIISDDGVVLVANAPVVRGRENAVRVLGAMPGRRAPQIWQPLRILVSRDGLFGATFGISAIETEAGRPSTLARYITVWRCNAQNSWQAVAHADIRPRPANLRLPSDIPLTLGDSSPRDAFARADLDFARLAADSGAPAAFARYASADAITFAGSGEINIGPGGIRARMMEGRTGTQWRWHPVVSFVAATGDLGATVGEAEIRVPGSAPFYSKYLTVWQRQPDGSLKFVVDGGNSRPGPR